MQGKQVAVFVRSFSSLAVRPPATKTPAPKKEREPLDRVDTKRVEPIHFLHKTFTVKKYVPFEFEVPPHSTIPRPARHLQVICSPARGRRLSDESADV